MNKYFIILPLLTIVLSQFCDALSIQNRVISNDETVPTITYQANIRNSLQTLCGAVLLSNSYALTAAHCLSGRHPQSLTIEASGTIFKIDSIMVHPNFDIATLATDLAMLKISKTDEAFPDLDIKLALPDAGQLFADFATFVGYGVTNMKDHTPSGKPMQAQLPIKSETSCRAAYTEALYNSNTVCAGGEGYGLCWGDAGSGLVQKDTENGMDILIGIGSYGFECGAQKYPSVFTAVNKYLDWIQETQTSA